MSKKHLNIAMIGGGFIACNGSTIATKASCAAGADAARVPSFANRGCPQPGLIEVRLE